MRSLSLLLLCSLCCGAAAANVVWYDGQHPVTYQLTGQPAPVVYQALRMFADDMQLVTGHRAVAAKTAPIRIVQGRGSDDGFSIRVQNGQLVIEGHNARGTAYGILELSRMAEVSPWVWWGDVRPHTRYYPISVPDTFRLEHTPSVAYRGIFINDEDWSLRRWSPDNMGPQTYRRLFELMLRLRANTLWPAMHDVSPGFYTVKGNKEMADSFGIVIGTSHCEPLLRNNVAEWDHVSRGPYNYITNAAQVRRYWADRLQQVKGSDVLLTLGMRGIHDGSMEGVKTPEEKLSGLQQVIDDQRQLISKHYNKHVERVPQVFIPYKEVLEIMESGLRVPDDVTLMWCDDNYGYLTRLPDAEQQKRQGGGGVYYHLSYWGRPHDYLWLTTTQPGLIYTEMRAAYDHNCRRLWIANVHDPKVAAYQLELFLDMAWDINSLTPNPSRKERGVVTLEDHYERWLMTQFGGQVGRAIAPAMREFIHLNAIRRPEFMGWTQVELDKKKYPGGKSVPTSTEFSLAEAYKRMEAFARIEATVETYRPLVMDARQDAYFAHVLYPVHAAAAMTRKMLSNEEDSRRAYQQIQQLTERYNTMNGGKWRGLMSAAPRNLPVFGETRTQLPQHPSVGSYIARNAYSPTPNPSPEGRGIAAIQMLGHSMNAVAIPKGSELTYEFETPLPLGEGSGERLDAVLYTAMIPTQPSDRGDLRYSVQIDDQQPVVISLKEPYRSERWKQNVLRGQALKKTPVKVSNGRHTLRIKALDDHIIFDQWMLDFCPDRQFYVIPVSPDYHTVQSATSCVVAREGGVPLNGVYNVRDFGAKGDGRTLDSPAINAAIKQAVKDGGGQVLLPAGTYLSGSIRLKSNIDLHLSAGAKILAVNPKKFPPTEEGLYDPSEPFDFPEYQDGGHTYFHNSLIWAEGQTNVSITGHGMIDGEGLTKRDTEKAGQVQGGSIGTGDKAIALKLCRQVTIRDITIYRGGHFAIIMTGCDLSTIDNVTIDTNRDGFDIDCCKYMTITNCKINTPSDDALVLKSSYALKRPVITEHIAVANCNITGYKCGTLLDGTCVPEPVGWVCGRFKLGTESNGGYRNISLTNSTFAYSSGLAFEEVDQGRMENIVVSNITMSHVHHYPIYITTGCRNRGPKEVTRLSSARDIQISNLIADDCDSLCSIIVTGMKDEPIRNVWLSNIRLYFKGGGTRDLVNKDYREQGTNYPEPKFAGWTPAYGLYARHVVGLHVRDVTFRYERPDHRPAIVLDDVRDVSLKEIDAPTEAGVDQIVTLE